MRGKIIPEGSIPADSMPDGNFDRMALENRNLYKLIESIQNKKMLKFHPGCIKMSKWYVIHWNDLSQRLKFCFYI